MTFSVALPTNVFTLLMENFPDMKIAAFRLTGTSGTTMGKPFKVAYGTASPRQIVKFNLNKSSVDEENCKTITRLYAELKEENFVNGNFSYLEWHMDIEPTPQVKSDYVRLAFGKYTPHRSIDKPRVIDGGAFPDEDLYSAIEGFRSGLPPETKPYYKSTVMTLMHTHPNDDYMKSEEFIQHIFTHPMLRFNTCAKQWNLKGFDMKKGGKAKDLDG